MRREKITTAFLFLLIALNLAGFIVREYMIIKANSETIRWIDHLFAGAHLAVALCAFLIWRGLKTALYILLTTTFFVIIVDLAMSQFDPAHHASVPDIILAFSESVILIILLKPWKNESSGL